MNKLRMIAMCLFAMMVTSLSVKAQEVTITLMPGWTWISVPITEVQDFATTLGSFTPMNGDIIKSQWGNASYTNGQWRGNISQFYPGYGYMYKSTRTMPVTMTFNVQQPDPQVIVTTAEPTDITTNSATCGGSVTSSSGDYVFVFLRGICWGTTPNPTFNDNYMEVGSGLGNFTVSMTNLAYGTTYYVRAFAVTPSGTFYGEEVSISTIDEPDYVDLGLPSGLLWATCNIGATTPEGYGYNFAWGETQPKNYFGWDNYKYCNGNGSDPKLTKYCTDSNYGYNGYIDNLTILLPEDDAATANWGSNWRMPNKEEWQELYQNTSYTWTTQNGVCGQLFIAPNGNSLFLPAPGGCDFGDYWLYWSSSLYIEDPTLAWVFIFYSEQSSNMGGNYRNWPGRVRAVRSAP